MTHSPDLAVDPALETLPPDEEPKAAKIPNLIHFKFWFGQEYMKRWTRLKEAGHFPSLKTAVKRATVALLVNTERRLEGDRRDLHLAAMPNALCEELVALARHKGLTVSQCVEQLLTEPLGSDDER